MRKTIATLTLVVALAVIVPLALAQQSEDVPEQEEKTAKSKDPVCNMMVRQDPDLSAKHAGKTYYFCMRRDLEAFEKDPDKYLEGEGHTHPDPALAR